MSSFASGFGQRNINLATTSEAGEEGAPFAAAVGAGDIPGAGTIAADTSGGGFTLTLPLASNSAGPVNIKHEIGGGVLTIAPSGADTIARGPSVVIPPGNASTLRSNGVSSWLTF